MVGHYKVGQPYKIKGRWYRPEYDPSYSKVGTASWYGADFHGLPTANGEVFDKEQISAAHPTLPLPSIVRVTNLENGRSLDIRVNDRGPFIGDRLIDLSEAAARELGYEDEGLARVQVDFLALADDARGTPPTPTVARSAPRPAPVLAAAPKVTVPACARGPGRGPRPAAGAARCLPPAPPARSWSRSVPSARPTRSARPWRTSRAWSRSGSSPPSPATGRVARVRLGPVADPQAAMLLLGARGRHGLHGRLHGSSVRHGPGDAGELLSPLGSTHPTR